MDYDWDDFPGQIGMIVSIILLLLSSIVIANNYIEWRQYDKDSKIYAGMYPPTTMMNNGVQYTCTFTIPEPDLRINLHIDWSHWYIYLFCLVIIGCVMFVVINFIPLFGGHQDP